MILITEFMDAGAVAALSGKAETQYLPDLADRQGDIPAMMGGIRALIVRNRTRVTAKLLDAGPDVKVVGRLGVGLDNIALDACKDRGVEVIPAIGANNLSVAEYVITNALTLLRNAYHAKHAMIAGDWPRMACAGREVAGKTLGLIGFGAIARETARMGKALGMAVCATDPFVREGDPAWEGVERQDIDGVLRGADVVSLHVPLVESTHHMINTVSLAQMKPGAILVNAARGGVVDEAALVEALNSGHIGGAALDVFEVEPLTAGIAAKFKEHPNLILTPHIAGVTEESNVRVSNMIANLVLTRLNLA
jgi:(S)-sulfolactate dehydrogenase